MTEDKMVGCRHQLNRHGFEWTLGDGEGQGSLAWCSPWGCKESDRAEQLNNNSKIYRGWEDGVELKKFLLVFPYCLSSYL